MSSLYHGGLQKPVVAHECDIVTQGPSIEVPGALNLSSQPVGTTPMRWPSIHIQVKHCPLYSEQAGHIVIMFFFTYCHSWVVRHHVVVDCQDGFAIRSEIEDDGCF